MNLYPLKFEDIFKETLWGGNRLKYRLNKNFPPNKKVGESWEVSDHGSDSSVVKNGKFRGKTLNNLFKGFSTDLVGKAAWCISPDRFPLLVKFIDATEKLSVQVHPDNEFAEKYENNSGKTEAWYVVDAKPGAELICGLSARVSKELFLKALQEGNLARCLNQVAVVPGDVIFLPAGRPHALKEGILVYEVQQNSDLTYRIWDWGRPRKLHLEKGLKVIDFNFVGDPKVKGEEIQIENFKKRRLVVCKYFASELLEGEGEIGESCKESFHILSVIRGRGEIRYSYGKEGIVKGESVLMPASLGSYQICSETGIKLIKSYVPKQSP